MAVYLPEINFMEVEGFNKIFKEGKIIIDFSKSLNMLLGGNGLGKTTLLQCIVYALTGGTNSPEIEANKSYRWDNRFFIRRVNKDKLTTASIRINFNINNVNFSVKRGINNNRVLEFMLNEELQPNNSFEEAIIRIGNYDNYYSYSFVVNRLLYLPENRRSLMWDYEAQVRSIMILNNDIIDEARYRSLRVEIKNLDSTKRHTTVRINKIDLTHKEENELVSNKNQEQQVNIKELIAKRKVLSGQLKSVLSVREEKATALKKIETRRDEIAQEIEKQSEVIRHYESKTINTTLKSFGQKKAMLFDKTVNYGICPCCGESSPSFQAIAKQRLSEGKCLVCGQSHDITVHVDADIQAVNAQLQEKLSDRDNVSKHIYQLKNMIESLDEEIFSIRKNISEINYNAYVNADRAGEEIYMDDENSELALAKLISDRENLESDIRSKSQQADEIYENFRNHFVRGSNRLSIIYQELASDFLGKTVTLEYEKSPDKFVEINYLIPKFDDEARRSPEDCSEAQRFFLDIAFRMSLILLNHELTGTVGTFISETPEAALDVSYVNNVVKMFSQFMQQKNKLILSNNLQRLGLAYELVKNWGIKNISIFDLLKHGKLSDVQQKSKELFEIRDEILGGVDHE